MSIQVQLKFICCSQSQGRNTKAFSVAALTLWNIIPDNINSAKNIIPFRHHMKTHRINCWWLLHCSWLCECWMH